MPGFVSPSSSIVTPRVGSSLDIQMTEESYRVYLLSCAANPQSSITHCTRTNLSHIFVLVCPHYNVPRYNADLAQEMLAAPG